LTEYNRTNICIVLKVLREEPTCQTSLTRPIKNKLRMSESSESEEENGRVIELKQVETEDLFAPVRIIW